MSGVRRAGTGGSNQKVVRCAGPSFGARAATSSERSAVLAGIRAGDAARERFDQYGVLVLFGEQATSQPALPRLGALQSYAEMRRALLPRGHEVPPTSLLAMGFTTAQIARFDAMIAGVPTVTRFSRETAAYPLQRETGR